MSGPSRRFQTDWAARFAAEDQVPVGIDLSKPSPARIYDYWLGGRYNFPADREAAEKLIAVYPDVRMLARANRAFLGRSVQYMSEHGVRQFLDLGAGLPTERPAHEVAREIHTNAHVIYVDSDPVACAHARTMLERDYRTVVVEADIRDPALILENQRVIQLIDWDQPVGLLMVALLHFILDADDPARIIGAFAEKLAPGSYLALSHAVSGLDELAENVAREVYRGSTTQAATGGRPVEQIAAFFEGFTLVEPGLVDVREWRSTLLNNSDPSPGLLLAGVGRLSGPWVA